MQSSVRGAGSSFRYTRLAASFVFCFSSSSALAGGTAFDATSISAMGNASAGQAAEAGDASVLFANPAALTRFKRAELTQGAAVVAIGTDYTSTQNNDGADSGAPRGQNGQVFSRKDGFDAGALAPNLYVAIPINEKLVMGFGASASHGLVIHYDENFPGRNQGRDIDFKVTRLNLGLGYKLSPTLSLGVNGSYERYFQSIKLKLNYREAVEALAPGSAALLESPAGALIGAPPIPGESNAGLRMFGWAFNAQVGGLWEPTEKTRVGISYRPKTEFTGNRGKFKLNDSPEQAAFRAFLNSDGLINSLAFAALGVNGPQAAGDLAPEQIIKQEITLPDELRISVFHHATPKLDLMGTYTRQDFSVTTLNFQRESNGRTLENIPQNFKAAESYRVGLNYKLYKRLTLRAGYAIENSVIDDATRITILPDSDRQYFALGGQFDLSRDTSIHFAYQKLDTDPAPVGNNRSIDPPEVRGGEFQGNVQLDTHFFGIGFTERF
ncbi:OmpP1/FadL family transporter [Limnobacter parvus]|uniref:Outer membrane protein transport protein n=1 Tax=Limnobacter parvus TaxID=2939690 RepID=A0ABT1XIM4_9BURK|nr:outer membrane protein transport protein [Limnobacter parvus]MCR2747029.1 outer membrane protein transport protein [Limnobacter parvus]